MKFRNILAFCFILSFKAIALTGQVFVNPGADLKKTIESAPEGSTIVINAGLYKVDNIQINKRVTIIGKNFPTFEGNKRDEVITVNASGVVIRGLRIQNAGVSFLQENAGIKLNEAHNCIIENNILENNFFGIYLAKSSFCVIRNNEIKGENTSETNSGNGIHLWYCKAITIEGNNVVGHRDGIYFEFVKHSLVRNNYSAKNLRYGLHFMFSDSCTYISNTFESNGAGVAVMYTKNVTMRGNRFVNNWGSASFGVLLKDLSNCLIEKNYFERNTNGLYLEGCSRITVISNEFVNNGWALKLMANSMGNFFFDNNFIANSFDVLTNSMNNFNIFSRNFWSSYSGYDLDRDGFGDVPYRPVKMFSVLVERHPAAMILLKSLFVELLNFAESVLPSLTPIDLIDDKPRIKTVK